MAQKPRPWYFRSLQILGRENLSPRKYARLAASAWNAPSNGICVLWTLEERLLFGDLEPQRTPRGARETEAQRSRRHCLLAASIVSQASRLFWLQGFPFPFFTAKDWPWKIQILDWGKTTKSEGRNRRKKSVSDLKEKIQVPQLVWWGRYWDYFGGSLDLGLPQSCKGDLGIFFAFLGPEK